VFDHWPTHRITLIFVAIWCIIWCFDANKKACKWLICRLLASFGIVFRSGNGSYFEHIETILALIQLMLKAENY